MSRMTARARSKAPSESTIQEEDEFSEDNNSECTDVSENSSFLSLFDHILSTHEKIDLICLLDDLLCQNLDVRYSKTAASLTLHTALAAIAILMAKLGLVSQAFEKLDILLAKSFNMNSLTTAIEINMMFKRVDKAEKFRRRLEILKNEDFNENEDFGPIEKKKAEINSKNYLIAEKIIFISHLKHDGDETILDLFEQLDPEFEMAELEFIFLKIQLKDTNYETSQKISDIIDSDMYSTETGFGVCNRTLLGLITCYKNKEAGHKMIENSIKYASSLNDMLTMDRLTKILMDNNMKKLAVVAASQNLEVPTIQALEFEAMVQFNNGISSRAESEEQEDFQLISKAEKTVSDLVAGYSDNFSPNIELSLFLLKIRYCMFVTFDGLEMDITETSLLADMFRLENDINRLNLDPTQIVSHMKIAILKTKLLPDKRLEIFKHALKTPSVRHEGNVVAMVTVIRDTVDSSGPIYNDLPTFSFENLDSLVKTKLFVGDGQLIWKYKSYLRKIFKCDLPTYCLESSKAGFLNLNKLCFEIISLSKAQIDGIIGEKINKTV